MTQLTVTKSSPSLWRVTFDNPPVNLVGSQFIIELRALLEAAENDPDLAVVLFESADPEYFIAHWDLADDGSLLADQPSLLEGMSPFTDVLIRLSRLPALTVSAIRGRVRGAGSEFVLATDIRFASLERAVLGQFEITGGAIPGGGAVARLPRLVGRGRALEIMAGGEDFDGALAERYGYVNRAVPDAEFDAFIDEFVRRVSGFSVSAIRELKREVDPRTLPKADELATQANLFFAALATPEVQEWARQAFENGLQKDGPFEENLAEYSARFAPKR
ncbi:enoyl-CoA hydratase/isomerase family protein [Streptomyces sp. NBC_01317]|uniref:enoyl-CoA hydratase/isomerase family protein n=1 Tax=Streptomyces sp. NBC_01317 TaxID=2903822 RepID=UPI002E0FAD33|nr:enoyl-CoA hydratase/isomerase family protein [Streptomyces sp. NBC_01317]